MLRLFTLIGPTILGFATLILGGISIGTWAVSALEARALHHTIDSLNKQLDDPTTGYKIRLSTCEGNQQRADGAISLQNGRTDALAAEGSRRAADTAKGLQGLQASAAGADKRIAVLQAPITGSGSCARLLEVERRYRESHP